MHDSLSCFVVYVRSKGKLFEDLDALAGTIAFQHCERDGKVPLLVVVAVAMAPCAACLLVLCAAAACRRRLPSTHHSLGIRRPGAFASQ